MIRPSVSRATSPVLLALALIATTCLGACGQRGPLYIPDQEAHPLDPPAIGSSRTPAPAAEDDSTDAAGPDEEAPESSSNGTTP